MKLFKCWKAEYKSAFKTMKAMNDEIRGLREKVERLEKSGQLLASENDELHAMCRSYETELKTAYEWAAKARGALSHIK